MLAGHLVRDMDAALLNRQIVAFSAEPFAKIEAGTPLPTRLRICPWGTSETGKGTIICNATTAGLLMHNQEATKRTRIALDFQHNSVEGSKTYTGEPLKVAAYGDIEVVPGDGIYLSALEWTPEGREHAENGHYPDISPAIKLNDQREIIWVHSAGLVRQGEIDGLELFDAGDTLSAVLNMGLQTGLMSWTGTRELLNMFMGLVGVEIPDSATFDEMKELAGKGAKKLEAAMETPEAKAAAAAIDNPPDDTTTTMNATERQLLTDLQKRLDKSEKKSIEDKAVAAGKVIPLSAADIDGLSVEQFAAICDKLPAGQVRTESRGDGKVSGTVVTFGAADREVMQRLGLTEEQWKKANPTA